MENNDYSYMPPHKFLILLGLTVASLSFGANVSKASMSPINQNKIAKIGNEVNGLILNEKKEPIIGASILIKGTKQGVITDASGNFKLVFGTRFG